MARSRWAWTVGGIQAGVTVAALVRAATVVRTRDERSERELNSVLAGLADAVHVHDATGRTVYANQAAADLMGLDRGDVVGAPRGRLASHFDITTEDGRPVAISDFPGHRLFAGDPAPPPLLTRSIDRRTGAEMWTVTKATAVPGADGRPALAVNVIEDVTEAKQAELAAVLLAEAGEVLGGSLEPEQTLDRLAALVVPRLADWCGVDLPGHRGRVEVAAVAHADPGRVALARELRERHPVRLDDGSGLAAVLGGGPTVLSQDITDADLQAYATGPEHLRLLRSIGFRHLVVAGMRTPGAGTVGALTLVRGENAGPSGPSRPPFRPAEVQLVEELARRAGTAVLNARLYRAQRAVAGTLQRSLLPPELPSVPGLEMAAYYRPAGDAGEVGGDFYDAYPLPDGWLLAIGDVTGKGAEAAALTGLARAALEAVATLTGRPERALAHLDELLARRGELAVATAALVHLQVDGGGVRATVRCAGHPAPLLLRGGEVLELAARGTVLGALPEPRWPPSTYDLHPGDVLVLRTDGATDTATQDGERLGEERLRALLSHARDPEDVVARVRAALGGTEAAGVRARDDVAVLAVGIGERPMAPAGAEPRLPSASEHLELDGSPASVAVARRALDAHLEGRLDRGAAEDARLMLSELASNAVRHAGGPYEVDLELDVRRARVTVSDRGHGFAPPRLRPDDLGVLEDGGRGLAIVDRLSARWGIDRGPAGTRVWFELDR